MLCTVATFTSRAYNRLARLARAPLLAFVQDDEPPPEDFLSDEVEHHAL